MPTLTIRLPEEKHDRLRNLAKARGISLNKLIDELATQALVEQDVATRFLTRAQRGSPKRALALLKKIEQAGKGE